MNASTMKTKYKDGKNGINQYISHHSNKLTPCIYFFFFFFFFSITTNTIPRNEKIFQCAHIQTNPKNNLTPHSYKILTKPPRCSINNLQAISLLNKYYYTETDQTNNLVHIVCIPTSRRTYSRCRNFVNHHAAILSSQITNVRYRGSSIHIRICFILSVIHSVI